MAKVPYIGVDGVARKCKSLYIGVDGVARKVKSGYIGVNGVAKQFYSGLKSGPLSSFNEGNIIYLNENGSPVEFYVAKRDYESGLNGTGRTLVVRKQNCPNYKWATTSSADYSNSNIDTWLNSTYKERLDANIINEIANTKFYYTSKNENNSVVTLERAIFQLSLTEYGKTASYANTEGSTLPIASMLEIAKNDAGNAFPQWTRTPNINIGGACIVNTSGNVSFSNLTSTYAFRPAFTLPEDTLVTGPSM